MQAFYWLHLNISSLAREYNHDALNWISLNSRQPLIKSCQTCFTKMSELLSFIFICQVLIGLACKAFNIEKSELVRVKWNAANLSHSCWLLSPKIIVFNNHPWTSDFLYSADIGVIARSKILKIYKSYFNTNSLTYKNAKLFAYELP